MSDPGLKALQLATQALSEVKSVTREVKASRDLCDERNVDVKKAHEEVRAGQTRIHDRIDDLATRWVVVAGGTILVLLSASGFLLIQLLAL